MPALARGQASSCSNPEIDVFTRVNGVLTDVASLEFTIEEDVTTPGTPIQVFPPSGRETVDVATLCPTGGKISTGRFVAAWTPDLTEPIGTHIVNWFFKLTPTSPEQTFAEEFEVLPEVTGSTSVGYCTIGDIRSEGVPSSGFGAKTDAELQILITRASRLIDMYTGRFFEPRTKTFRLDGTGRRGLLLGPPIISITSVSLISTDVTPPASEVDLNDLRIYNRHLTQELLNPDDRDNPRIEFLEFDRRHEALPEHGHLIFHPHRWPQGTQNVEVAGIFGYTDADGSPNGQTPLLISRAACLMTLRDLDSAFSDPDKRSDARNAWRVTELKTREQTIKYASPDKLGGLGGKGVGAFTGDPEIDAILAKYARPPDFGAV